MNFAYGECCMMSLVRAQFGEPIKRDPKFRVFFYSFLGAGLDGNNGKAVVIELRSNSYELRRGYAEEHS